jgi:hypothetical protein
MEMVMMAVVVAWAVVARDSVVGSAGMRIRVMIG